MAGAAVAAGCFVMPLFANSITKHPATAAPATTLFDDAAKQPGWLPPPPPPPTHYASVAKHRQVGL